MKGMGLDAKKYHGAGKGAAPRKGADYQKYREGMDRIDWSKDSRKKQGADDDEGKA